MLGQERALTHLWAPNRYHTLPTKPGSLPWLQWTALSACEGKENCTDPSNSSPTEDPWGNSSFSHPSLRDSTWLIIPPFNISSQPSHVSPSALPGDECSAPPTPCTQWGKGGKNIHGRNKIQEYLTKAKALQSSLKSKESTRNRPHSYREQKENQEKQLQPQVTQSQPAVAVLKQADCHWQAQLCLWARSLTVPLSYKIYEQNL